MLYKVGENTKVFDKYLFQQDTENNIHIYKKGTM